MRSIGYAMMLTIDINEITLHILYKLLAMDENMLNFGCKSDVCQANTFLYTLWNAKFFLFNCGELWSIMLWYNSHMRPVVLQWTLVLPSPVIFNVILVIIFPKCVVARQWWANNGPDAGCYENELKSTHCSMGWHVTHSYAYVHIYMVYIGKACQLVVL